MTTTDALTRLEKAAARVGDAAAAHDADEVRPVQQPLAADRAAAVAKRTEWLQAAEAWVPVLKRWQRAFNDLTFDRLKNIGREGRARRLVHEGRKAATVAIEAFASTPAAIERWIERVDAHTSGTLKYESLAAVIDARHREIWPHLDNRPYGAELIAQFEATAAEVEELTTGAVRIERAASGTPAALIEQIEKPSAPPRAVSSTVEA